MKRCLGKRRVPDRQDAGSQLSVQKGSGNDRGRRRRRGWAVWLVSYRMTLQRLWRVERCHYVPIHQFSSDLLSQEAVISVRMRSKESEKLSRRLQDKVKRNSFSLSSKIDMEKVMQLTAETDDLLIRLNNYDMSKKHLEQKVFEQKLILKALTASVMQLEMRVPFLRDQRKLLQKTKKWLMRNYGKHVRQRSVGKLMKRGAKGFVWMAIFISRPIPTWFSQEISELDCSSSQLRQDWKERSE